MLGKAKPPTKAVAEALFALADDGNMTVRSMALNGLGDMGEIAVDRLARALKHRNQDVRMMAAMNLGRIGPGAKGALPALKKAIASGDSNLRVYLLKAEAAITGDSGKAVAGLIEAIRKDPRRGRKWNSQVAIARDNALLAIRRMGPAAKDAVPALREIVMKTRFRKNGIYTTSYSALSALLAIGRPASDTVLEIVKHPNPGFRKMVDYVIGGGPEEPRHLEILIEAIQAPELSVRLWALGVLDKPGWGRKLAPASPYIARLADDPAPAVQKLVASLLKKSGVSAKDRSKLLKGLRNPDFVVRKRTALTLAKDAVPPDEAIPVLVEILAAKRTTTTRRPHQTMDGERYLVLKALAKLGPKARPALGAIRAGLPQWLKGRLSGSALAALDVLSAFVAQSEPQLLLALESRRDTVKQKAAGLLARIGMPVIERLLPKAKDRKLRSGIQDKVVQVATAMGARAVKPLMKHLTGPDETKSSIASHALSGLGPPAVPDLVGLLKTRPSLRSVKVALHCLHDMGAGAKPAVPFVKKYASSPVRDVRWAALTVLAVAAGDDPKAVDILLAALADGDPVIRGNVARILGASTVAPDRAIPAIAKLLDDPDDRPRSWAIYALGDYGEPALPHLVRAFKDPHEGNRMVVVFKLGQMGIEALPTLIEALRSRNVEMRKTAAEALKRFGPLAVVCYLEAWRDPNRDVRAFAAQKLKEMGKVATPALLQMLRGKSRQ